jgi:hypothetical protein
MDLAEICRIMGRRWYVLLPGLLLTVALTVAASVATPVKYQSQSTVMLLNSQKATVAFDGNPFLSTQTSLTGMADSLARNLNSDASIADLHAQGATGTSAAKIADNAQGPLMWLTVTGTDKAAVLRSDELFTVYARKRLADFQAQQSVAAQAMIRMTTIVPPQNPVAQTKTRLEYLILAALVGLVISMVATFYVEARFRRPTGRRAAGRSAAPGTGVPGQTAEEEPPGQGAAGPARPAPRWAGGDSPEPEGAEADESPPGGPHGDGTDESVPTESDAHRFV